MFFGANAQATFSFVTLSNNTAQWDGGALFFNYNGAQATFFFVTLSENTAGNGGAIYAGHTFDVTMVACAFVDNYAPTVGGHLWAARL